MGRGSRGEGHEWRVSGGKGRAEAAQAHPDAGADGLEIEVHNDPPHAWSDGAQCLKPDKFADVIAKCRKVAAAIGREM